MYGHKARESLIAILKDDPILIDCVKLEGTGNPRLKPADRRKIADRILIELWMRGWSVPEIGAELELPLTRVSDEKYKALRKLEHHLRNHREVLEFGLPSA